MFDQGKNAPKNYKIIPIYSEIKGITFENITQLFVRSVRIFVEIPPLKIVWQT